MPIFKNGKVGNDDGHAVNAPCALGHLNKALSIICLFVVVFLGLFFLTAESLQGITT